jgi:hypothetical protein
MKGKIVYSGVVQARAYGIVREPFSRAIDGLKVQSALISAVGL